MALELSGRVTKGVRRGKGERDMSPGRLWEGVAKKVRLQAASETRPSSMPA
jgi:hypothetical protein